MVLLQLLLGAVPLYVPTPFSLSSFSSISDSMSFCYALCILQVTVHLRNHAENTKLKARHISILVAEDHGALLMVPFQRALHPLPITV